MSVHDQPVALNGKIYIRSGDCDDNVTVLEYTPGSNQWAELPPPPVRKFTVATLRGQLLVVGGRDKSTHKVQSAILIFNEHSRQWIPSHPAMPTALTSPTVIEYQNHLIVTGGWNSHGEAIRDVNVLDDSKNWKTSELLHLKNNAIFEAALIENSMYLVCQSTQTVLRAHLPTLISGAKFGVWETLPNISLYYSSPVTIGNTLLTMGGTDKPWGGNPKTSIQMYNPTTNQWTEVGNLPEPMEDPHCVVMSSKLFVFYYQSVHISQVALLY